MRPAVEIYRCDDVLHLVEVRPLSQVLRTAFSEILGLDLSRAHFKLYLYDVPAEGSSLDRPVVENLMPEYGYAKVVVFEDGDMTYQHPHTVDEVIGQTLHRDLARRSVDAVWGYRVVGPGVPRWLSRPAPRVVNAVQVARYDENESPGFRVHRVPDTEPPEARLADFQVMRPSEEPVKVVIHWNVARQLTKELKFSDKVEEGGFLVGRVFRDRDWEGTFIVEVTGAIDARYTGASLLHFTFTGDSFQDLKRQLREREGEQLLGWYHTHLFPAKERMGLSTIDLDLHFTTFRKPWQLAGLINLETGGVRTLRFYVRKQNQMDLCPQFVTKAGESP